MSAAATGTPACEHSSPSAASPASFAISSVQAPSPNENTALMPSSRPCLTSGPPVASMPPKKIASGFLPLILVSTAFQSVVLSVPFSRGRTLILAAVSVFSTSFARPSP